MPKQVVEIKSFHAGTISTPEEADIPLDATPNSENIEPVNVDGRLEGRPKDVTKLAGVSATAMAKINDDGTNHVIYYDDTDDKIKQVNDLDASSPSIVTLSGSAESSVSSPTMEANNKEVHIGTGAQNYPKWAGFIENIQFDSAVPTTPQVEDARLTNPSGFPDMYKVVEVGGYIYGIGYQEQRIYKFKVSDKSFVKKSETLFTKLQGICLSGDSSHLWILDVNDSKTLIHKVTLVDMVSEFNNTFDSSSITTYTDILVVGNYLWSSKTTEGTAAYIYSTLESTITATSTISRGARTPNKLTEGPDSLDVTAVGAWCTTASCTALVESVYYDVPKVSLVDIGETNRVGWVVRVEQAGTGALYWRHEIGSGQGKGRMAQSSASTGAGRICVFPISYTQSVDDPLTHLYIMTIGSSGDVISSGEKVYSMSMKAGASPIITFGPTAGLSNSSFSYRTSSFNFGVDFASSVTYKFVALSAKVTEYLQMAYIFQHKSDSNFSGFEGNGTGRWMYKAFNSDLHTTLQGALEPALESHLYIAFDQTTADYGDGSTTPNAKIGFKANSSQFYKTSYLYDGYQESPLSDDFKSTVVNVDGRGVRVQVQLRDVTNLNRRISHICLYRADADSINDLVEESGFYRLVDVLKLDTSWSVESGIGDWGDRRYKYVTDNNTAGSSYDARVGISEALTDTTPNYSLSTQLNNTHFIADIKQVTLGNLNNYILKSKPLRFDQFNYLEDFLALPTKPTAIQGFNGRLYAFDENNTYRIEPNNFYIEDIYEGVGCRNADSVIVTEYGMFFADKNNIYMHDGQRPHPIGNPILRGKDGLDIANVDYRSNQSYEAIAVNSYCKVAFDGKRNSVLVFGLDNAGIGSVNSTFNITSSGSMYGGNFAVTFSGGGGSGASATATVGGISGQVVQITLVSGGSGYTSAPTIELDDGQGAGASATCTVSPMSKTYGWLYTIAKKRWDKWYINHADGQYRKPESLLSGTNGEVYYSDGTDLVQLAGNASNKENWNWYSKEISGGIDTVDKKFYEIYIGGKSITSPALIIDGTAISSSISNGKVSFATTQGKKARIGLTSQTGEVDSIGIVYRQLKVTANATV